MSSGRMWPGWLGWIGSFFSNTFSLFQLESKTTVYKQCWPYISYHLEFFFLGNLLYIKTCNVEPFCSVIKSVLLRREHK